MSLLKLPLAFAPPALCGTAKKKKERNIKNIFDSQLRVEPGGSFFFQCFLCVSQSPIVTIAA